MVGWLGFVLFTVWFGQLLWLWLVYSLVGRLWLVWGLRSLFCLGVGLAGLPLACLGFGLLGWIWLD